MSIFSSAVKLFLKCGFVGTSTIIVLDKASVIDTADYPIFRAARTSLTVCSILADYKLSLISLEDGTKCYEQAKSLVHTRSAEKLLKLCWKNRGTYVKVGQHLGGMDYLLPDEYTKVLKVLHSSAPQSSIEDIKQVVCQELGLKSVDEIFTEFSPTPLGTASLAQVHKARLKKDNSIVAVKVQHPKVRNHSAKDIKMMESGLKLVLKVFPDFQLMWLSEETKENLPIELDFRNELENCRTAADNLKVFDWVKLPQMYPQLSTSRVLVMEFLEGGQVNDQSYFTNNGIDYNIVSRMLGKLFSEMIFVHGFVHCDPHPGNILVRWKKNNSSSSLFELIFGKQKQLEIILLDHGLYRRLSEEFRFNYANLWQSIIEADLKNIEYWSRQLGSYEMYPLLATIVTGRSWEVVGDQGIQNVKFSKTEDDTLRDGVGEYLVDISHVLNRIPREMLLVLKTNDHLRGLEHFYGVRGEASGFLDMSGCCLRALRDLKCEKLKENSNLLFYYTNSFLLSVKLQINLLKIHLYEWYLWWSSIALASDNENEIKEFFPAKTIA